MPNYQERSELLRQLANQAYFDAKNKPNPQKDNVQVGGYDGRTGRYQVIHADGGVSTNGVSLSNAAPPSDRFVRGVKNPNTNAVPMEWRSVTANRVVNREEDAAAVLNAIFLFQKDNKLYVGGDRAEPEEIYELEDGYSFNSSGVSAIYIDTFGNEISPSSSIYPLRTTNNLEDTAEYTYAFGLGTSATHIKKIGAGIDDYIVSFVLFDFSSTNYVYKYGLRVISGGQLTSKNIEIPQIQPSSIDPEIIYDTFPELLPVKTQFQTNFIFNGLGNFFFQNGYFVCTDKSDAEFLLIERGEPLDGSLIPSITSLTRTIESRFRTVFIDVLSDSTPQVSFKDLSLTNPQNSNALPPIVDQLDVKVSPDLTLRAKINSATPFDIVDSYLENIIPVTIDIESNTVLVTRDNGIPTVFISSVLGNSYRSDFKENLFFYTGDETGIEIPLDTVVIPNEEFPEAIRTANDARLLSPNLIGGVLTTVIEIPTEIPTDGSPFNPETGLITINTLQLDGESEPEESEVDYFGATEEFYPTLLKSASVFV
jgi:hypothetical protein